MDDIVVRKGSTSAQDFPHRCVFSAIGADRPTCVSLSSNFRRNADGCSAANCNSAMRRCRTCVEIGRGSKANVCTDPISGMCDEHKVGAQPQRLLDPKILKPAALPPSVRRRAVSTMSASFNPPKPSQQSPQKPTPAATKPTVPVRDKKDSPRREEVPRQAAASADHGPLLGKRAENPEWKAIIARVRKAISEAVVVKLPPERFRPMPDQPRDFFDEEELESLKRSIEEVGQVQDGLCRLAQPEGVSDHELLDGERRWRCVTKAALPEYRAKRVQIDDEAAPFLIAAISNFNRPEHTPLEKANVIHRLFTHKLRVPMVEIAKLLGISVNNAYKLHSLKNLPQEVWDLLDPKKLRKGEDPLPLTGAYEIARLTDPVHAEFAKDFGRRVFTKQLPLHKLRAEVDRVIARSELASGGGHAGSAIRERDQPARQFRFVERKIDLVFGEFDTGLDRLREMAAEKRLPPDACHIDGDMNRLIRLAKEAIVLVGGRLDPEHGDLQKAKK